MDKTSSTVEILASTYIVTYKNCLFIILNRFECLFFFLSNARVKILYSNWIHEFQRRRKTIEIVICYTEFHTSQNRSKATL